MSRNVASAWVTQDSHKLSDEISKNAWERVHQAAPRATSSSALIFTAKYEYSKVPSDLRSPYRATRARAIASNFYSHSNEFFWFEARERGTTKLSGERVHNNGSPGK